MDIGLVFDLDGILTDTAEFHYRAWKYLANSIDIEIDRNFNERLKGVSRKDSLDTILEYGGRSDDFSQEEKEKMMTEKNDLYKEYIADIKKSDLLPNIEKFLNDAKAQGIKMSIASASKNAPFILKKLEVYDFFEGIVDPNDLQKGKPDPEIFVRAAEILDLTPEQCIGLEDSEAGIQGINEANMFSVGIGDKESLSASDYFLERTSELDLEKVLQAYKEA